MTFHKVYKTINLLIKIKFLLFKEEVLKIILLFSKNLNILLNFDLLILIKIKFTFLNYLNASIIYL
jgi:hypothetical protein